MNELETEKKKQVIGLYGEMQLAMILHEKGWQVHRAYIDEGIDFTITKYWCPKCERFSNQHLRYEKYDGKKAKCVTNLCEHCSHTELNVVSRYLQVKTSEGIETNDKNIKEFSFHPKIRYDMGNNVFYVWIAVFENDEINNKTCHFYIFNTKDVSKFDNTSIDTYQITDNQKTSLKINSRGQILNKGKIYNYACFNNEFYNNFEVLEKFIQ
ncbi:MAG: hypothetical protein FWF51_06065 [Chitinivibrionia bacterium]|jgi:hypothetical protein|nr:hypothetical protein [Chitinivibrionia bacterium]